jgi:uncharacterized protein YukE
MGEMTFHTQKAQDLAKALAAEISSIEDTLNKIKTTKVDTTSEWWKGESQKAFVGNFDRTKKDVVKGLKQWLEEYKKLMNDVVKAKEEQEKALKAALSK